MKGQAKEGEEDEKQGEDGGGDTPHGGGGGGGDYENDTLELGGWEEVLNELRHGT